MPGIGRTLIGALSAGLLLAASGAGAGEIRIGALLPFTGDLQAHGQTAINGIRLAVDEINAAGGVLGAKLAVVEADTQTNPQAAIDAAQKLVAVDRVVGIVGAMSSGVTIPVAKSVTAPAGIPQISNASTSPVITTLDDNDFLFRTVPSDLYQGRALAQVADEAGYGAVSILYVNNDYGEGLAKSFARAFEARGGAVRARLAYEQGNASYRGELARAARGGADALVLIGYPETGIIILRQALEEGYFERFVFTDGMKAPEIIDAIGAQYLEGAIGTVPQADETSDAAKRFRSAYAARFGELPPKPFIDTAYDATYLLALAMEKAGSAEPRAVRDALRQVAGPPGEPILPGQWAKARRLIGEGRDIDYAGAAGPEDFDRHGDVPGTFGLWRITGGKIVTVKVFTP